LIFFLNNIKFDSAQILNIRSEFWLKNL